MPEPLPQFVGTAVIKPTPQQRAALLEFVVTEYESGRSLREIAALTDRSQTAIRKALAQQGVRLRGPGAPRIRRGK